VADLAADTMVTGGPERYEASVSPDWEIWGPNGGYLAAIAMRAAVAESRLSRVASLTCHYLGVAQFGPVALEATVLRAAKRAESLRVSMSQDGRPVLDALVWTIETGAGLEHDHAPAPDVPRPEDLRPVDELAGPSRFSFFRNLEERPTAWSSWEDREPGEPRIVTWFRFRPTACYPEDPEVDLCRPLIATDVLEWPAATLAHRGHLPWTAPTLELSVRFHRSAASEWLLCRTSAPVATEGLLAGTAEVWDDGGRLVATASQQMLFRPRR
jgi:acyl-CoA thioesterase II